jgi:hypothetical protein
MPVGHSRLGCPPRRPPTWVRGNATDTAALSRPFCRSMVTIAVVDAATRAGSGAAYGVRSITVMVHVPKGSSIGAAVLFLMTTVTLLGADT